MLLLAGAAGCGWISAGDRDRRWDIDQDGVERPADCDDHDPGASPRQPEVCDDRDRDEDCDGLADDDDPSAQGRTPWCLDRDGDGQGDPSTTTLRCDPLPGWVADCTDSYDQPSASTGDTGGCGDPPVFGLTLSAVAIETPEALEVDASPAGPGWSWTFDWGDETGASAGPEPTATHAFGEAGFWTLTVEATDRCHQTGVAQAWVAVAAPGALLAVTTTDDEDNPEQIGSGGWLGNGLSLREALELAQETPGTQVIAFAPGLGPLSSKSPPLPAYADPKGAVVGRGVEVGGPSGLEIDGVGSVVAGLRFTAISDSAGALRLVGAGSIARDVAVTDGAGIVVKGDHAELVDATLARDVDPQIDVLASATVTADVSGGQGTGVRIRASDVRLELCRIHGNAGAGVSIEKHLGGIAIVDSTVVGNTGDGLAVDKAVTGLDLRNDVFAFNGGWGLSGSPGFALGAPDYDLWSGNALGDCKGCRFGSHTVFVDPRLTDLEGGDLTPLPDSPAIDAGTPATGVDRNGAGQGAYDGIAPDIGAIEVP